jgi:hypothetical protein
MNPTTDQSAGLVGHGVHDGSFVTENELSVERGSAQI